MSQEAWAALEEGDSGGTPQDREGAGVPKSPPGLGGELQLRVLRPRASWSEPHHPISRALRGNRPPTAAPPGLGPPPETQAWPLSVKRRGQPGPHPDLGAIPVAPSSHILCQFLQLLPGLGKAGPRKPRSGPHVLAANPPSRSNQIGPCWQTGLRGDQQGAQSGTAGHQPRPDSALRSLPPACQPHCRAQDLLCLPLKPQGSSRQPGPVPLPSEPDW